MKIFISLQEYSEPKVLTTSLTKEYQIRDLGSVSALSKSGISRSNGIQLHLVRLKVDSNLT